MTPDQWKTIRHFSPSDTGFGDPEKIDFSIVSAIDQFRDLLNTPIHVTFGTQGAHVAGSQHYLGLATDLIFPEKDLRSLAGIFKTATECGLFHGVGIYPHWRMNGIRRGGIHVDTRKIGGLHTWMGVPGDHLAQIYIPASEDNFTKWGLL